MHGREEHREDEGAEQRKGDRPCHGAEEPAFHLLQREDGQVSRDNDANGVEDGALDLVGGLADDLDGGARLFSSLRFMWRTMFSTMTTAPSTTMPKSKRAEREQVGGDVAEVEADGGEKQRERDGEGDDDRATDVPKEEEKDDHHEDDALGEIVQNGVRGQVDEVVAIEEGDDPLRRAAADPAFAGNRGLCAD